MTANDIDSYLAGLEEPARGTLADLRRSILEVIPDCEQCLAYGLPGFKVRGKTVAGFAAFANHLSYLPHSGSVLSELAPDLVGYERTKGSLHFAVDHRLPPTLVRRLIEARLNQLPH